MPQKNESQNVLALILLVCLGSIGAAISFNEPADKMMAEPNTVTNFICEMQGKWSSEFYDISDAKPLDDDTWVLTIRDSGNTTRYKQRAGEDCRVEKFPKPEAK